MTRVSQRGRPQSRTQYISLDTRIKTKRERDDNRKTATLCQGLCSILFSKPFSAASQCPVIQSLVVTLHQTVNVN